MHNVKNPFVPVPLELMGGLYTEATPESLPAGASSRVVNCDFVVGSVTPRPGKRSEFYFDGVFIERIAAFARSIADVGSTGEDPWANPTNATLDVPASQATVSLNFSGGGGAAPSLDQVATANSLVPVGAWAVGPITPSLPNEWALLLSDAAGSITVTTPGWTAFGAGFNNYYSNFLGASTAPVSAAGTQGASGYHATMLTFFTNGFAPGTIQEGSTGNPLFVPAQFSANTTHGNSIMVMLAGLGAPAGPIAVSDNNGNTYAVLSQQSGGGRFLIVALAENINGGNHTAVTVTGLTGFASGTLQIDEVTNLGFPAPTGPISEQLQGLNFGYSIPDEQGIFGFQVEVTGSQSNENAGNEIIVSLITPSADSPSFTAQLPLTSGTVTVAEPTENWGLALTNDVLNNPNFGVQVQAVAPDGTVTSFGVSAIKLKVWLTPDPAPNFNYLKTFAESGGEVLNMALGSDGIMYQEDAINNPGVLEAVYTQIEPDTFAQSATQDNREFIALSDLSKGTDIPLTYTPPNFDRLSQVGPGAPPSCSASSAGANVVGITQTAAVSIPTSGGGTSGSYIIWSDSPQDHGNFGTPATPGNVMTWVFPKTYNLPSYIVVGANIVISGVQTMNGYNPNNGAGTNPAFYTITSVGTPDPHNDYYNGFTITLPQTGFYNLRFQAGSKYQSTKATMTTSTQIPNLEVGNQFQLSGTGGAPPAGYDSTWQVLTTPNAAQMQITSTVLTSNVATYGFTLITGTNPVVGEFVTVSQTLNGNGIFNVVNGVISAASAGSFSINIVSPSNVTSAAEDGAGIIFGTIFGFDAFAIIGNKLGGTIVTVGVIAAGVRKLCYSFLSRNGFMGQPSPIATADIIAGASGLAVANLLTGPSNTIARVIHLTGANGGNFFNIPEPVPVLSNGVNVVSTSTWVNDNTTTNVILSFDDAVLLAGSAVDIQGNNLFECAELGSSLMLIPYASRMFALGEQNKLTNLLNWSFDGGIGVVQTTAGGAGGGTGQNQTYPAGWTVDVTSGAGGSVTTSDVFGQAYTVINNTGSTQAIYGMITQGAFQDEFEVAIIEPSTTYSVRVTAEVPTGAAGGALVIDLFSPAINRSVGTYVLPLTSVGTSKAIYTGTLLTTTLAPVPSDLQLRYYITSMPNGVQVNADRVEVFPTEQPTLSTQLTGSYVNNFEAFDQLTGVVGCAVQNQQPVRSAFVLFDTLYIVKSGSMISTIDNGTTEPSGWDTRTVSNAVGAAGINAVTTGVDSDDSGEEWAIIAGRPGAYIFTGGQPIKLSEEIQSLWNTIYWKYEQTIWVKNDITNRRILIGVPMRTKLTINNKLIQNPWMPAGVMTEDLAPTTPNVIFELNYKQINTGNELAGGAEVHRSYSGKLVASEITRKWSVWTIKAPCAAFLTQGDKTAPLFLGNSDHTGKIYDLIDGLLEDDGTAWWQIYATYGFVPSDQGQGLQMGTTRFLTNYMTLLVDGFGSLTMTVFPNSFDSPYSHTLLPNLELPASTDGDIELPMNDEGSRFFMQFSTNAVGAGFNLSRVVLVMRQAPWAPIRGVNN